jgi:hypothetical protein
MNMLRIAAGEDDNAKWGLHMAFFYFASALPEAAGRLVDRVQSDLRLELEPCVVASCPTQK